MPYVHDIDGRHYVEREAYPRRRARTGTEVRAYREGREAYRSGADADWYMEYPPYPLGGPLVTAFWQGFFDGRDEQRAGLGMLAQDGEGFTEPNTGL